MTATSDGRAEQHTLDGKRILITGGTGSLGRALTRALLSGTYGRPRRIVVFSRDEAKQHAMRLEFRHPDRESEDAKYGDAFDVIDFRVGDVRDEASLISVLRDVDVVFGAAALKQVPVCEYHPLEAVRTNVLGVDNIVRAIQAHSLPVECVIGISTDKACHPVNVMGMTKAIQERILINGNLLCPSTRFLVVRYGNVLASRGSVVPLFHHQIRRGGPVTITLPTMTRFLLSLEQAVTTVMAAYERGLPGEVVVPKIPSAKVVDIATVLIGERDIPIVEIGIRPGEKVHEVLVTEDEAHRTLDIGDFYMVQPGIPELVPAARPMTQVVDRPFSSGTAPVGIDEVEQIFRTEALLLEDEPDFARVFLS